MNTFASDWLALREPLDHVSRNLEVFGEMRSYLSRYEMPRILDLAGGTGSTIRGFQRLGFNKAYWWVVDSDADLLKQATRMTPGSNTEFDCRDVTSIQEIVSDFKPDLVTTSAFLDLVSEEWMCHLADALAVARIPFYSALTYNGQVGFSPRMNLDDVVIELVNEHQLGDKGFGPALGPGAVRKLEEVFKNTGYSITSGPSDWIIGSGYEDLCNELLGGWADAATQLREEKVLDFEHWLKQRRQIAESNQHQKWEVSVGHTDVFAWFA